MSHPGPPVVAGVSDLVLLGSGGFADVYKGRQDHTNRAVAVKLFRIALVERDAADQFRRECHALGRLADEPGILQVFSAGVQPNGRPYLVMERCDNSLLQLLGQRGGRLPVAEAAGYGYEVATALIVAHSAQVLHGDITPQNILLRRSGAVVLADFGLAVLHDFRGNTATGFNPAHAAPEVLENAGAITPQTDVYGLGSTLHTVLMGEPPFALRPGEDERNRSLRILTQPPPRVVGADVPAALTELIASMLAKDPLVRPALNVVADQLASVRSVAAAAGGLSIRGGLPPGHALPPAVPPPPVFAPPPVFVPPAAAQQALSGSTNVRDGAVDAAGYRPGHPAAGGVPLPGVEPTVARAGMAQPPVVARAARPRWLVPAVAAAVALAGAVTVAVVLTTTGGGSPAPGAVASPAPSTPAPTTSAGTVIQLDPPKDDGATVALHWSGMAGAQYNVIVAQEGQADPRNMLTHQATAATVEVDPAARYCFRVQASDGVHDVQQSNVRAIRGAVCRFQ